MAVCMATLQGFAGAMRFYSEATEGAWGQGLMSCIMLCARSYRFSCTEESVMDVSPMV